MGTEIHSWATCAVWRAAGCPGGEIGSGPTLSQGHYQAVPPRRPLWESPVCVFLSRVSLCTVTLRTSMGTGDNRGSMLAYEWMNGWMNEQRVISRRKDQGKDRGYEDLAKASSVKSLHLDGGWRDGQAAATLTTILIGGWTLIACEGWRRKMGQEGPEGF